MEANLADELGSPEPHAELFESFAVRPAPRPTSARRRRRRRCSPVVRTAAANDPAAALAMVAAYEVQAADIAGSKSDGLRQHYGFDEEGTRFWDVHRTQEVEHAGWSMEALAELGADPDVVQAAAIVSADSWWLFLSEREELAPAGAPC